MQTVKSALFFFTLHFALFGVNVTVLTFKVNVGEFHPPPAVQGFASTYRTELGRQEGLTVLERENLADITSEIALGMSGLLKDTKAAFDTSRFEGVDYIIGGEITQISSARYRVDVAIREVKTAKIVSDKISGNITRFSEEAAGMLAHNTAFLITGTGSPIEKKVIPSPASWITLGVGLAAAAAGGAFRYLGEMEYRDNYGSDDMALDEFDQRFNRAQGFTTGGEIALGAGGTTAILGAILVLANRRDRSLIRE